MNPTRIATLALIATALHVVGMFVAVSLLHLSPTPENWAYMSISVIIIACICGMIALWALLVTRKNTLDGEPLTAGFPCQSFSMDQDSGMTVKTTCKIDSDHANFLTARHNEEYFSRYEWFERDEILS